MNKNTTIISNKNGRYSAKKLSKLTKLLIRILSIFVIIFLLLQFVIGIHIVHDNNMYPKVVDGDFMMINDNYIEYVTFADTRLFIPEAGFYSKDVSFEKLHDENIELISKLDKNNTDFADNKKTIYKNARKLLNKEYYAFTIDGSWKDTCIHGKIENKYNDIFIFSDGLELLLKP